MTSAIKKAMAPFGKNFFSSGDSMLVILCFAANVLPGRQAGYDM